MWNDSFPVAFEGTYEITAVSFHAYAHLTDRYVLLPHGASMGDRYGPIVVSRRRASSLNGMRVAVPGELTTAFLVLRLFDPAVEYVVMPFDRIQPAVHAGEADAGLLIHEGQLTWADEGLEKIEMISWSPADDYGMTKKTRAAIIIKRSPRG